MSDSVTTEKTVFQFPWGRAVGRDSRKQTRHDVLTAVCRQRAREKRHGCVRSQTSCIARKCWPWNSSIAS